MTPVMPTVLSEWLSVFTLVVLMLTLSAVIWYSWETRRMRLEMERSRRLTAEQNQLLREEHERRYDAHVSAADWDASLAKLTLVNAGPGPAVQVSVRLHSRMLGEDQFLSGTGSSIPVGATLELALSPEQQPSNDFPRTSEEGLTVEIVTTTALGREMPTKILRPTIRD